MALNKAIRIIVRPSNGHLRYLSSVPESKPKTLGNKVPSEMRAWHLNSYKGLSGLELAEKASLPALNSSQDLLIQVKAASVNPLDGLMSNGYGFSIFEVMQTCSSFKSPFSHNPFPIRLGRDFSGIVVDKGLDNDEFKVGDEVWGSIWPSCQGSFADYIVVPKLMVGRKPDNLSHAEAAAIPYAGLTCWSSIVTTGNLGPESSPKKILVVGASGGLGTIAVQLLKAWKHEVVAIAKGDALPLLEDLGSDRVLDYTQAEFKQQLKEVGPFDIILNYSGGENDSAYLQYLQKGCGSKFVSTSSPLLNAMDKKGILFGTMDSAMELLNRNLASIRDQKATYRWAFYAPSQTGLDTYAKLIKDGKMKPIVDKVYKFEELKEALQKVAQGGSRGKLVVQF